MIPLKYSGNAWRAFEILLISCENSLILTWSVNCIIVFTPVTNQGATCPIADTELYVPVVNSSTQDNAKLNDQLKSGF